jgi:glycosyltransferase involved in cell wall biosynthesis
MKKLSIIIPVYNEEQILQNEIDEMIFKMDATFPNLDYEVFLVENGSTDQTKAIVGALTKKYPVVRAIYLPVASYGLALRAGLLQGEGINVIIFNIDFWDLEFIGSAFELISKFDAVVGSKNMPGAQDRRSFSRRFVTKSFNRALKILFGFQGTDTHGIKMFIRDKIVPVVRLCKTSQEIFDTELILRAQKMGLKIAELPVGCEEKRETREGNFKKIRRTLRDLVILFFYLRK